MFQNHQLLLSELSSSACDGLICSGDNEDRRQQCVKETGTLSDEDLENLFIPPPPDHDYWESDRFSEDYGSDCDSKSSNSSSGSNTSWGRMVSPPSFDSNDDYNKTKTTNASTRRRKKGTSRKRLYNSYYSREEKNHNNRILLIPNIGMSQNVKQLESHISL
mmetsp:Transcript_15453/g.22817  ORF Transcript_15453/g.22817 Transcript_15453/m.22817 type:complete len:162 (-) Transcript_15453:127-612(-)